MKSRKYSMAIVILVISCLLYIPTVGAVEDQTYENNNGIVVSQDAHDIIVEAYGQEYFDNMTEEQYDSIKELFEEGNTLGMNTYEERPDITRSTNYFNGTRRITIIKSCGTDMCTILTTLVWAVNPQTRSYDVIGARFNSTSLSDDVMMTRVQSSAGIAYSENWRELSNGIGASVNLPNTATDLIIDQLIHVEPDGAVFASYQHAEENLTLAASRQYTFGVGCYGNVFCFYGDALNKYDQMGGVSIVL